MTFLECKRHTRTVTGRQWDASKAQLKRFIRRWEERNTSQIIYALTCIGEWNRSANRIVKVLFVECKRHTRNVTDRQWDSSKAQLTGFIRRWEERDVSQVIYALTCIGEWVRFFEMSARQSELVPFGNREGAFSITDDTAEIASILRQICTQIHARYRA